MYLLYFDPGLGAMLVQAVVAAVAAVVLLSKGFMFKIKSYFGLIKTNDQDMFDDIDIKDQDIESKKS